MFKNVIRSRVGLALLSAAFAATVASGISVALADTTASTPDQYYACVGTVGTLLNRVKAGTMRLNVPPAKCPATTDVIKSWNAEGIQGEQGSQGLQGAAGPEGPAGPPGRLSCDDEVRIQRAVAAFELSAECDVPAVASYDSLGSSWTPEGGFSSRSATGSAIYQGPNRVASGFIMSTSGDLDRLDMLLHPVQGPAVVDVTLVESGHYNDQAYCTADTLERPIGQTLESWRVTSLPGGTPNVPGTVTTLASQTHPSLNAGQIYWVILSTEEPSTSVQWLSSLISLPANSTYVAESNPLNCDGGWDGFGPRGTGYGYAMKVWTR